MTTTGTAELVSAVIEKARRLIAQNVKPVNNGIRCAQCERTKRQILGHFDGEGGCSMGDLADAVAAYDARETAAVGTERIHRGLLPDGSLSGDLVFKPQKCGWCGESNLNSEPISSHEGQFRAPCVTDGCSATITFDEIPVPA